MRRRLLVCSWNEPVADACCLLVSVGMPFGNHNLRGKQNPCSRAVSITTPTLSTRPEVECWPYLASSVGPSSMNSFREALDAEETCDVAAVFT